MSVRRRGTTASTVVLGAALAASSLVLPGQPGASRAQDPPPALRVFRDVTAEWGIDFVRHSAPEKKFIVESMSGGVALLDFDNDDRLDIYFVSSLTVATRNQPETARSALYRNLGGGRFEEVAVAAGVAHPGWGMGVCVADVDGDGWQDLYVTAIGSNRLYLNRRDGTFEDVAEAAGVAAGGWSAGCGFADYDRDGDLDLFVSRYVAIDLDHLPEFGSTRTCQYRGIAVQCGPRGLPGLSDLLFRNEGNDPATGVPRFVEVSKQVGVLDPEGHFGLGIAWVDFDGDGWLDLFVANDSGPNFLFVNQRDGTFSEEAFPMGVAVSEDGGEQGGMGVAIGDYDRRGRPHVLVTNFAEEYNALYHNQGAYFSDVSFRSKTAPASLPYVGWGTAFFDYDNDGWLDLIVANGHVYPQLDHANLGASAPYRQRRLLYRNLRDGTFEEIGTTQGEALNELRVSRGLAVGDLDGDGRLDVVINDLDGAPQVLRNEIPESGHWLLVDLEGRSPNTSGIGAMVTVRVGDETQRSWVRSGTSYLSQDDLRQHFGVGAAKTVDSVEVLWPDGSVSKLENVAVDQRVVVAQAKAVP
ncbi:MAG TPA: CRTAC1 family protein [Thermoanaerobaculia bacterium]|nr:CRTAC1 family protein [Thermoanaerobaculia bacterium]